MGDGVAYTDYGTTHFILNYLAELGLNRSHEKIELAANRYLNLQQEDGDFLKHFSCLYAYNIRTFIMLGYRDDPRLQKTIDLMLNTERSDYGYLCDMHEGKHKTRETKSCIRGSLKALLAFAYLPEYREHPRCQNLLTYFIQREGIFKSTNLNTLVNSNAVAFYFPFTWRNGLLEFIYAVSRMGYGKHPAFSRALNVMNEKHNSQGSYPLDWTQAQSPWKVGKRGEPNKWVTLYALLAEKYREEYKGMSV